MENRYVTAYLELRRAGRARYSRSGGAKFARMKFSIIRPKSFVTGHPSLRIVFVIFSFLCGNARSLSKVTCKRLVFSLVAFERFDERFGVLRSFPQNVKQIGFCFSLDLK